MDDEKTMQRMGACKYCGQTYMIEADELLAEVAKGIKPDDAADLIAVRDKCDCNEAKEERKKQKRFDAAGQWARETFGDETEELYLALYAIRATFIGSVDRVTFKIGKQTYKVDRDKDAMIRLRQTYQDSDERRF